MAVSNMLQMVFAITENLSCSESRSFSYLCGNLDTESSTNSLREMLKSKVMSSEMDESFLLESLFVLRRFDLIRKVFGMSREDVDVMLRQRTALSRFRVLMANVSEDMASEDLNSMKFLLNTSIPREKMEKAKTFLDVIVELEKSNQVSSEKVDVVEQCLRSVGRVDLAKKVHLYRVSGEKQSPQQISQQQRVRETVAFPTPISSYSLQQSRQGASNYACIGRKAVHVNREQSIQCPLDWYKINTNDRGVCVIIDCVGNDGEMLENAFKGLCFRVTLHKWLNAVQTRAVLTEVSRQRQNSKADAFICCVISRATSANLLGTDSHSTELPLDTVRRLFTAEECPMLAGKPKLFFIQSYSVPEMEAYPRIAHRDEDLETDGCSGPSRYDIPVDADIFWSHCRTNEHQLEQNNHHSVYLNALTDSLHNGQRRKAQLDEMHTEVNRTINNHNKNNPAAQYHIDLRHTLTRSLYF